MPKPKYVVVVALVTLLAVACGDAATATVPPVPTDTQVVPTQVKPTVAPTATSTELPRATATEAKATATATQPPEPTETTEPPETTAKQDSEPATSTPESAEEDAFAFLQVGSEEWTRGPADAPVTIIEYADFQ